MHPVSPSSEAKPCRSPRVTSSSSAWMSIQPRKRSSTRFMTPSTCPLKQVPGVRAVTRMQGEPFTHQVGGEAIAKKHEAARYTAIYEIDGPDVLMSSEWRVQGEKGRWSKEVRPFTKNRSHAVYKVR